MTDIFCNIAEPILAEMEPEIELWTATTETVPTACAVSFPLLPSALLMEASDEEEGRDRVDPPVSAEGIGAYCGEDDPPSPTIQLTVVVRSAEELSV